MFPVDEEVADLLPICYGLVSDTANLHHVKIVCRVANKSATSWQQVCCVVVMEFRKQHDTTDTTCYGVVTGKLYGETGVMDFGALNV